MAMFSLTRFWPMYSVNVFGRTLASRRASSSKAAPATRRRGRIASVAAFLEAKFVIAKSDVLLFDPMSKTPTQAAGDPESHRQGALKADRVARNRCSKLLVSDSRLALATAASAARSS